MPGTYNYDKYNRTAIQRGEDLFFASTKLLQYKTARWEGRVRRIDITVTPYAVPLSDYMPSDCCGEINE